MDLTVLAIPGFFGSMAYEAAYLRRRAERFGPSAADYERNDTIASLTMGTGSLVIPLLARQFANKFELGRGRWAKPMLAAGVAAAAVTAVADAYRRRNELEAGSVAELPRDQFSDDQLAEQPADDHFADDLDPLPDGLCSDNVCRTAGSAGTTTHNPRIAAGTGAAAPASASAGRGTAATASAAAGTRTAATASAGSRRERRAKAALIARKVGGSAAVAAIASIGFTAASTWAAKTTAKRLFDKRVVPDLGGGAVGLAAAVIGWDFIYYWNHRLQHESRTMWAIHVVHHSSERYNLSTALRQTWSDPLGIFVPYGALALLGVRPNLIETARQLNLLYQYWIHTDAIRSIGKLEAVLNTPSHHRAHHGSNRRYLDRNHGSILIIWDRLFGTFQKELAEDPVVYGLTKNIDTFNPLRIVSHEYADIISDVANSDNWSDRLSFVLRGPGWAYERKPDRAGGEAVPATALDAVGVA